MIGVNPSEPKLSTAAYITRAAFVPSLGATFGDSGVVLITLFFSVTQPWKKIRSWPATRDPVTSALPGPHRPWVLELLSSVLPPLFDQLQMCCDLNHSVE